MRRPVRKPTRWSGDGAALLCTGLLAAITVLTQGTVAAVTTGVIAAATPLVAAWARRHREHREQAWKIAAIAVVYCATWIAANAWRYMGSVGPCDGATCALGAPLPLVVAGMYVLPLALSLYQVGRLRAVRNQEQM